LATRRRQPVETAQDLAVLAAALTGQERSRRGDEAAQCLRRALLMMARVHPQDHPTLVAMAANGRRLAG